MGKRLRKPKMPKKTYIITSKSNPYLAYRGEFPTKQLAKYWANVHLDHQMFGASKERKKYVKNDMEIVRLF